MTQDEEYSDLQNKFTFMIDILFNTQTPKFSKKVAETALKLKKYGLASYFSWKAGDMEKYEKYKILYLSSNERFDKERLPEDPKNFGPYAIKLLGAHKN